MHILKKIFKISLVSAFVILILSQALLKNPVLKNKMSELYEMESMYVYSENESAKGYIIIQTLSPSEELYILQNGEKTEIMNKEKIKIDIYDNTVIEIDGSNLEEKIQVDLTEASDNIYGYYKDKIIVNSNITILGRFFLK